MCLGVVAQTLVFLLFFSVSMAGAAVPVGLPGCGYISSGRPSGRFLRLPFLRLSSAPERPGMFLRAVFWRAGSRSGGITANACAQKGNRVVALEGFS